MIQLALPWPPTVNTYYRNLVINGRSRVCISKAGRQYRDVVCLNARRFKSQKMLGRLSVSIVAHPPDRRKRDIDNLAKSVLDSLAKAGIYDDDYQIDVLTIKRASVVPDGLVRVTVDEI